MGYWRKHPRKDLERVLEAFHAAGWRIDDSGTYYRVRCPCGDHQRWIHISPSNPNYAVQAVRWMRRQQCDNPGGAP